MNNILVIAPHPDDEVIGCGGTIKKLTQQKARVSLCVMTKVSPPDWPAQSRQARIKELAAAAKALGVSRTYHLDFPAAQLDTVSRKDLHAALGKVISAVKPDMVFIPFRGDIHHDHQLTNEAAMVAYEDITDTFSAKVEAMKLYKSEIKNFPHPRSPEALKALAIKRGSEAGLSMAEAFVLIREIKK